MFTKMPYMKQTCVYDLAAGSDTAVNETHVAKEQDDAVRIAMVEAALSRVLDARPTDDNAINSPESGCSVLAAGQADTTWTPPPQDRESSSSPWAAPQGSESSSNPRAAPQDSESSSSPWGSDPVLCRLLVAGKTDDTVSPDFADSNPASPPPLTGSNPARPADDTISLILNDTNPASSTSTGSNPARSIDDTIWPDLADSNPAPAPSSSSSSNPTGSEAVWTMVSEPGVSPGLEIWASNPVWTDSVKFGPTSLTGSDSSTFWAGSEEEGGGSSSLRGDSDAGSDGTGNPPSGGSENVWCPAPDPVWSPPETKTTSTSSGDSDAGVSDGTGNNPPSGGGSGHGWLPALDPVWCPAADSSTACTVWSPPETKTTSTSSEDSDGGVSDGTGNNPPSSGGGSGHGWFPALDPVWCPAADSSTACTDSDSDARSDETARSSAASEDSWSPELDPVWSPVTDSSTSTGADTDAAAAAGGGDDTVDSEGSTPDCPQLDPVSSSSPAAEPPVSYPGQETLEADPIWGGSVGDNLSGSLPSDAGEFDDISAYSGGWDGGDEDSAGSGGLGQGWSPGLDTVWLQEAVGVCPPASDCMWSPALGFGEDREEEEGVCVEVGVARADGTLAVAKWFSCCCSRVASWFALPILGGVLAYCFIAARV